MSVHCCLSLLAKSNKWLLSCCLQQTSLTKQKFRAGNRSLLVPVPGTVLYAISCTQVVGWFIAILFYFCYIKTKSHTIRQIWRNERQFNHLLDFQPPPPPAALISERIMVREHFISLETSFGSKWFLGAHLVWAQLNAGKMGQSDISPLCGLQLSLSLDCPLPRIVGIYRVPGTLDLTMSPVLLLAMVHRSQKAAKHWLGHILKTRGKGRRRDFDHTQWCLAPWRWGILYLFVQLWSWWENGILKSVLRSLNVSCYFSCILYSANIPQKRNMCSMLPYTGANGYMKRTPLLSKSVGTGLESKIPTAQTQGWVRIRSGSGAAVKGIHWAAGGSRGFWWEGM